MTLKEYDYNGSTYQLTEADAKRLGATEATVEAAPKSKVPANKAATPKNKAAAPVAAKTPAATAGTDAGSGAE